MRPLLQWFSLTQRQKRGVLVLVLLLLLIMLGPLVYRAYWLPEPPPLDIAWYPPVKDTVVEPPSPTYKPFNPNTIDSTGLAAMALSQQQIGQWLAYRKAGGQFFEKDDVLRLYAITKEDYLALEPYIQLPKPERRFKRSSWPSQKPRTIDPIDINAADAAAWEKLPGIGPVYSSRIVAYRNRIGGFDSVSQLSAVYGVDSTWVAAYADKLKVGPKPPADKKKVPPPPVLDLNRTDSASLTIIRGIGPVFARRIVAYREKLGGFYQLSQLREVYGLRDKPIEDWAQQVTIDTTAIQRLSLNRATQEQLAAHPYISSSLARFIISYRLGREGGFTRIDELLTSFLVDEQKLKRLRPYLTL